MRTVLKKPNLCNMIIESCVTTLFEALMAQKNGAHRIELCENIEADGTTPSKALILSCVNELEIPIKVLVRPRAGNFVYNTQEIHQTLKEIETAFSLGIDEVVIGMLSQDSDFDYKSLEIILKEFEGNRISIHKAIDSTNDIITTTKDLASLQVITSILTSGGKSTAKEGSATIKEMIKNAELIEITAAGKITKDNLPEIHEMIDGPAYHGRRIVSLSEI